MTYPDLIYRFFNENGIMLLLFGIILVLIILIFIIVKFFALPKIKELFTTLDRIISRVEKNENEISNVKIEVEVTKTDAANAKETVNRMAEVHEKNMSELKLIVHEMQETSQEIAKAVYTMLGEHRQNHKK